MLYFVVGFLFCIFSSITVAESLSLEDAIALALIHNPNIQTHGLDKNLALSEIDYQKSLFLPKPSIEMSGVVQEERAELNQKTKLIKAYPSVELKTPMGTSFRAYVEQNSHIQNQDKHHDHAVTLIVKQPLSKGFKRSINQWPIQNAQLQYELEKMHFRKIVEEVVADLIVQFMIYQQTVWTEDLQKQFLQQTEKFYNQMRDKFTQGRVAENDLISPQLQIKQAKQSYLIAQLESKRMRQQLFEIIGLEDLGQVIDMNFMVKLNGNNMYDFEEVLQSDVMMNGLSINAKRLQSELLVTKDAQRFDLNMQADMHLGRSHYHYFENLIEYGYYHSLHRHNKGYAASLNLSIPLGEKHLYYQQLLVKNTAIEKNKIERYQRQKNLRNQYDDLIQDIDLKKQQQQLIEDELKLSELEYESSLEKYSIGRIPIIEVTRAKERHHLASINLSKAKLSLLSSQIKFQQLAGKLLENWHVSIQ
ncbi:MAG: TolC family protein [Candidatus Berkiella sp.]